MSTHLPGLLTIEELRMLHDLAEVDTVIVAFPDLYGRLVGKRFSSRHFLQSIVASGTHACDYLLTVDMEMEPVAGYEFSNWDKGYGDFHLVPDMATMRKAAWLDRTAIVICDLYDASHSPVAVAPRSMLRRQIEQAATMGFQVMAGSEAEYYLYDEGYRTLHDRGFYKPRPAGDYVEDYHILQGTREEPYHGQLRRVLEASAVPVECTKGEWGLGQHELNLLYADVLEMSDRHCIYKQCAKELAESMGRSVTFMAKPDANGAGSSCHVHISLWREGQNVFAGDQLLAGVRCSDTFRWFLGGWMRYAADMMVLMAPTINSYKRYLAGSWAPTRIAWSMDNRTAGFRVVGGGSSLRIECRIPGADANPYITYAGSIAAGLAGIRDKIEPPEIFQGNVYQAETVPKVAATLRVATDAFEQSSFVRNSLGDDVARHYTHFFRTEQNAFDRAVTDWERRRYFERI